MVKKRAGASFMDEVNRLDKELEDLDPVPNYLTKEAIKANWATFVTPEVVGELLDRSQDFDQKAMEEAEAAWADPENIFRIEGHRYVDVDAAMKFIAEEISKTQEVSGSLLSPHQQYFIMQELLTRLIVMVKEGRSIQPASRHLVASSSSPESPPLDRPVRQPSPLPEASGQHSPPSGDTSPLPEASSQPVFDDNKPLHELFEDISDEEETTYPSSIKSRGRRTWSKDASDWLEATFAGCISNRQVYQTHIMAAIAAHPEKFDELASVVEMKKEDRRFRSKIRDKIRAFWKK